MATYLSRPVAPYTIVFSTIVRNLQIAVRYLPNLLGNLAEMGVRAAFFFLMASAVTINPDETMGVQFTGQQIYTFFLGSLVLFTFTRSTLWGPINAVTNDLYNGTLEYLYSLPGSKYAYYVGVVTAEVIIGLPIFIPLLLLLVFQAHIPLLNVALILLSCLLVLTALTAMGVMISLLALLWRQVGSIASVLGILFEMLAGAYLPLSAFPPVVRAFSYLLPFTWGYDIIRYYSFSSAWHPILPAWQEWGVLILFAVCFTIASRYLLKRAEQLAKRQGLNVI
jgi:ABC-2 type transport system permease protein